MKAFIFAWHLEPINLVSLLYAFFFVFFVNIWLYNAQYAVSITFLKRTLHWCAICMSFWILTSHGVSVLICISSFVQVFVSLPIWRGHENLKCPCKGCPNMSYFMKIIKKTLRNCQMEISGYSSGNSFIVYILFEICPFYIFGSENYSLSGNC